MASWEKRLMALAADPRPNNYRYEEVTGLLGRLGFELAGRPAGSHRRWRLVVADPAVEGGKRTITVGLVDNGNGPLKSVYVKEMVRTLRENNLLPSG